MQTHLFRAGQADDHPEADGQGHAKGDGGTDSMMDDGMYPDMYADSVRKLIRNLWVDGETAYSMMLLMSTQKGLHMDDPELVNMILENW